MSILLYCCISRIHVYILKSNISNFTVKTFLTMNESKNLNMLPTKNIKHQWTM